jgi:hypothetical protein
MHLDHGVPPSLNYKYKELGMLIMEIQLQYTSVFRTLKWNMEFHPEINIGSA